MRYILKYAQVKHTDLLGKYIDGDHQSVAKVYKSMRGLVAYLKSQAEAEKAARFTIDTSSPL